MIKVWKTVILEAFAQYLQKADDKSVATDILARWLWERLSSPPQSAVDRVLHVEIRLSLAEQASRSLSAYNRAYSQPAYVFKGNSVTGAKLLKSLYEYCLSYEQQKWSRWVHSLKASDFNFCE